MVTPTESENLKVKRDSLSQQFAQEYANAQELFRTVLATLRDPDYDYEAFKRVLAEFDARLLNLKRTADDLHEERLMLLDETLQRWERHNEA